MVFNCWQCNLIFFPLFISSVMGSHLYFDAKNENDLISEGRLTMEALDKALTFLYKHKRNITKDVIFGVLIARENLKWIQARLTFRHSPCLSKKLANLIKKSNIIIEMKKFHDLTSLRKDLWDNSAKDLTYELRQNEDLVLFQFDSCQSINDFMMKGTPEDSDFCINELILSQCLISDKCWTSEMKGRRHSGYKTSHRLIYLLIAERLKCDTKNPPKFSSIHTHKKNLCQQMLREARSLHYEPHFPLTQDLFLEQIALCGLEGHKEFAPKFWRNEVLNFQNRNGCFGSRLDVNNCSINSTNDRVKRTDSVVDNCHLHVTAVGISVLAFYVRVVLTQALLEV